MFINIQVNLKKNSDCRNFNTRNKNQLTVPFIRLLKIVSSLIGNCVKFYKLPSKAIELPINKFKTIKKFIV